ncbi:DUF3006 domain-containing protein [Anoxynatronum buryatiense]|uniref:DUF3006 domain-containing protein n=1 Tax=Anoxynatronum buryatiense TaxID=489973 RepID=A0AA45WT39_9CLOT|nr:DUF3006 domain-containing protein [Anoxynatronum buryatiense]SMP40447.1 Protein of unknown function [Anoxynatronum buryatiense]
MAGRNQAVRVIDRFEGQDAVVETHTGWLRINQSLLPVNVVEGDLIIPLEDGTWQIDVEGTEARRRLIQKKMDRLLEKKYMQQGVPNENGDNDDGADDDHGHR